MFESMTYSGNSWFTPVDDTRTSKAKPEPGKCPCPKGGTEEMKPRIKWIATILATLILVSVPLAAFARELPENQTDKPAPTGWADPLRPLWQQLQELRAQHAELIEELRARNQANRDLAAQIRAAVGEEVTPEERAIIREMHQQLLPLREQAAGLREEGRALHEELVKEWEKFRDHFSKQQLQPCMQCLERIIEIKTELIGITGQLLNPAEQAGQILYYALNQLQP
jgi:hypothetical protein